MNLRSTSQYVAPCLSQDSIYVTVLASPQRDIESACVETEMKHCESSDESEKNSSNDDFMRCRVENIFDGPSSARGRFGNNVNKFGPSGELHCCEMSPRLSGLP